MALLAAINDAGLGARHAALAIAFLLGSVIAHYLFRGYQVRKTFKDLEKQGIVSTPSRPLQERPRH